MFEIFDSHKEEVIRNYFDANAAMPEAALPGVVQALADCRGQVVDALGTAEDFQGRRQLALLYEGLTVMIDFITNGAGQPDRENKIASDGDGSAPAVRD